MKQIYHFGLLKASKDVEPVSLVSPVNDRDELGPQVPNLSHLLSEDHLSLVQRPDDTKL